MNDLVKLDVGGTKFKTTRGTLTSSPNSLLAKMFDPDSDIPPAYDSEDGNYCQAQVRSPKSQSQDQKDLGWH